MSDTKTAADVMSAIAQTFGAKMDALKKSDKQHTAADVAEALRKATIERIDAVKAELQKMTKAEAEGAAALQKNIGSLPSETPSKAQIADGNPHKMVKTVFDVMKKEKGDKGVLPGDKAQKVVEAEGSGGDVTKGKKLSKEALAASPPKAPALKPAGIPGAKAGAAPSAPKPPQAPGAASTTHKMELPQTAEKANGGKITKKMELPQTAEKANGGKISKDEMVAGTGKSKCPSCGKSGGKVTTGEHGTKMVTRCDACSKTKKMELPQTPEKANGGKITKKMELPQTAEKANGGQMKKDEMMAKGALHPSPVFAVRPRLGGKDMASQHMTSHAAMTAHTPSAAVQAAKAPAMPSAADHAARANSFADFMPPGKFTKAELDSMKCGSCKKGMTTCKCE